MSLHRRKPALPLLREALLSREVFPPYFSIDDVAEWLKTMGAAPARSSLRAYLSRLLHEEMLHDSGRGWYCLHGKRPVLDIKDVRPLLGEVTAEFPLLKVTAWSTSMLNPWLHHLVGTGTKFIHLERDALEPVADHLEATGWKVYDNPAKATSSRVALGERTVILRPLHVHSPMTDEPTDLLAERILVDLRMEVDRLNIMDLSDYHGLTIRLASETRLMMGSLLSYAKFRKLTVRDLLGNQSTTLLSKSEVDRSRITK